MADIGYRINYEIAGVRYLLSAYIHSRNPIKINDLLTFVFRGQSFSFAMFNRFMKCITIHLKYVFGLTLSYINVNYLALQNKKEMNSHKFNNTASKLWKYRMLVRPIITALVMLNQPISEVQMWTFLDRFARTYSLECNLIKGIVIGDFVKIQLLNHKPTDHTTIMLDPNRTAHWFTLGHGAEIHLDQIKLLRENNSRAQQKNNQ